MTWVRLDDRFPSHRKALAAGPLGRDLFVCGLCYCNQHLTDGFIPSAAVPYLAPRAISRDGSRRGQKHPEDDPETLAERLVDVGLWEREQGGYRVHDYTEWNRSREEVEERKDMKRKAGAIGGRRSVEARRQARASRGPEADAKHAASVLTNPSPTPITPLQSPQAPASTQTDAEGHRLFTWPSPQHKAASIEPSHPLHTRWLPGRFPYEAFHHDCPEPAWRGHCVAAAWIAAHPGEPYPVTAKREPKQCQHHRGVQTTAQTDEVAW